MSPLAFPAAAATLVETIVATTLLMLLVLAVRRPVARAFGARAAYLLWWLPALRMILPPLPRLLDAPVARAAPGLRLHLDFSHLVAAPARATVHAAAIDWAAALPWAIGLWGVGAALFLFAELTGYRRFLARALSGATPLPSIGGVPVHASAAVQGPVAAGIVRRRILVPRDFHARYDADERRLALAHEAAHHAGHDLAANAAALVMLALHWFNPVARIAYRAFRADQELACDARVLAQANAADRYAYGSALVKAAWGRLPAAACALDGTDMLKRRLRMMQQGPRGFARRMSGGALALALVAAGLVLTASGGAGAQAAQAVTRTARAIVAPTAPAAPAAPEAPRAPQPIAPVAAVTPVPPVERLAAMDSASRPPAALEAPDAPEAPEAPEAPSAPEAPPAPGADLESAIEATVHAALEDARVDMAAACEKQGKPIGPDVRWDALALCGSSRAAIDRQIADALRQARAEIARERDMPERVRARVLASLDREIARASRR